MALAAVAGVAAGCTGTEEVEQPGGPDPIRLDDVRLVSYDSCDALLDWFHTEAGDRVGAYGLDGAGPYPMALEDSAGASTSSSAPTTAIDQQAQSRSSSASDESSTTNTQEPGVGEPDLAWTDGNRLVTVVTGQLQVVDLDAGTVTATLELSGTDGSRPVGLLVEGDHALVLESSYGGYDGPVGITEDSLRPMPVPSAPTTRLTRVDLGTDPAVVGSITVDGDYVDARVVDGVVRTVVRSSPARLGFVYPAGSTQAAVDAALEANRQVVADSTLDDWLPAMTVDPEGREGTTYRAADCSAVDHPATFGGFGVVTVVGLDLEAGAVDPLPSAAVVADAQTVYASDAGLYLATQRWPGSDQQLTPDTATTTPSPDDLQTRTDVHAFSLPDDAAARYEASGSVPGTLIGQFALSELDGDLRVATTTTPEWWWQPMPVEEGDGIATDPATTVAEPQVSESRVTVLRRDGDDLVTIGEVTGLGPTEQIRGVRFAGPIAYVVTFRQTDPLYVVDLGDPTAPRVAGELKIPGYSSYLQDLGGGRVLGLGQDGTETGRTTGFQESLFDVSDPANPQRLAQLVVPDAYSLAESDHHALLWWSPDRLLAVPVEWWGSPTADWSQPTAGVLVTRVSDSGIEEVGTIEHPSAASSGGPSPCPPGASCIQPVEPDLVPYPTQIERTLVADGRLVTVSTAGVKVSDMATLADQAWIPFP